MPSARTPSSSRSSLLPTGVCGGAQGVASEGEWSLPSIYQYVVDEDGEVGVASDSDSDAAVDDSLSAIEPASEADAELSACLESPGSGFTSSGAGAAEDALADRN